MYQPYWRVVYLDLQSHLCCVHHWAITTTLFWECELLLSQAESLDSFESLSQSRYFQGISRMMFLKTLECVSFDLEDNWCLYWNQTWSCIEGFCCVKFPFSLTKAPWSNTICSIWGMRVFSAMLLSVVWKQRILFGLSFECELEVCKKEPV